MTERLMIAYGLILLMTVSVAAGIWWAVYHSRSRTYARDIARRHKGKLAAARLQRDETP